MLSRNLPLYSVSLTPGQGGSNQLSATINQFEFSEFCRAYHTTLINDCAERFSLGGSRLPQQFEGIPGCSSIPKASFSVTEYNGLSRLQPADLVDVHTHFHDILALHEPLLLAARCRGLQACSLSACILALCYPTIRRFWTLAETRRKQIFICYFTSVSCSSQD